jgi:hypothetical protein
VPCTINLLAKATFAEPSTELPAKFLAVAHLLAVAAFPPMLKLVAVPEKFVPTKVGDDVAAIS